MVNNDRYKDSRSTDLEKSRSLDSEYEKYQYNDFDKSRSFDEEYSDGTYLDGNRAYNVDQTYTKTNKQMCQPRQSSPQNYGSRLYDHDMSYDMARKTLERSPLMDYKRQQQAKYSNRSTRDRSPNIGRDAAYRSMAKSFDHGQSQQIIRDHSPSNMYGTKSHSVMGNNSSPVSEYDVKACDYSTDYNVRSNIVNDELIKEAKLVTEFLYGNKGKAEAYLNQRRRDTSKSNRSHVTGTNASSGRYIRN